MATGDMFLKLDGIEGESLDDKHKNEIALTSFSIGASNAGSGAVGTGSGTSTSRSTSDCGCSSPRP